MALSPVRPRASMSAGSADTMAFTRSYSPALIASMNVASVSGMGRLYLPSHSRPEFGAASSPSANHQAHTRSRNHEAHKDHKEDEGRAARRRIAIALLCTIAAAPAAAQTSPDHADRPPLGSTLTVDALADLPSGGNLFTLLDTVVPEVITDRVDTGGLSTGAASRIGAHGSSWTQTTFRLDGVDLTTSDGSGAPLLLPGIVAWDHVDVATGLMPIDVNAPGLAISLAPRRPAAQWTSEFEGIATGPALVAHTELTNPPPTARLNAAVYGSALVSGPVGDRAGLVLAGSWNGSSRYKRADPTLVSGSIASLFAHVVLAATPRDEARIIGWAQRSTAPFENRNVFGQPNASEE